MESIKTKQLLNQRYEKISRIGSGSFGIVYAARDFGPSFSKETEKEKSAKGGEGIEIENQDPNLKKKKMPDKREKARIVAIKKENISTLEKKKNYMMQGVGCDFLREIKYLKELNHPNIVKVRFPSPLQRTLVKRRVLPDF